MALRDQPYLPLYVQDVLTDERLIECSAESHGVYFRLLCILHKQEKYGCLLLKQKYKQSQSKFENFAWMICRQTPFKQKQIKECLEELSLEGVIQIEEDILFQKRMMRDGELSLKRAKVGKMGGKSNARKYGKSGYLYLMSDTFNKHKIGVSVNPKGRLYRIRSDMRLPKHFDIINKIKVNDMGNSWDFAKEFFKDIRNGEWLIGDFERIASRFDLLQANPEANPEANVQAKLQAKNQANPENENESTLNTVQSNNNHTIKNTTMNSSKSQKQNNKSTECLGKREKTKDRANIDDESDYAALRDEWEDKPEITGKEMLDDKALLQVFGEKFKKLTGKQYIRAQWDQKSLLTLSRENGYVVVKDMMGKYFEQMEPPYTIADFARNISILTQDNGGKGNGKNRRSTKKAGKIKGKSIDGAKGDGRPDEWGGPEHVFSVG